MFPDSAALQREVRMMAAASYELILANLKDDMISGFDATIYKELEMTKKRWMFYALHRLGGYLSLELGEADAESVTPAPANGTSRVLALYETRGKKLHIELQVS
jgi:hypothetical protein